MQTITTGVFPPPSMSSLKIKVEITPAFHLIAEDQGGDNPLADAGMGRKVTEPLMSYSSGLWDMVSILVLIRINPFQKNQVIQSKDW